MGLNVFTTNPPLRRMHADVSRVLTYADNNAIVVVDTPVDIILTVPIQYPGFHCWIAQKADGKATVVGAAGVTIKNVNGNFQTKGEGALIKLVGTDPDIYFLTDTSGDGSVPPVPTPLPCTNIAAPGGTIIVPAGYWINGITIKKLANGTSDDFSIGTTPGGKQIWDDTLPTGAIGEVLPMTINRMIDVNTTLYFTLGFDACIKIFKQ